MAAGVELLADGLLCRITNAELRSNTYLLSDKSGSGACVVIDPGLDHTHIAQQLTVSGWRPAAVLCTHGHFDHMGGAARLQGEYQVPVYLPTPDMKLAKLANFMMTAFKIKAKVVQPEFTLVEPGSTLACIGRQFALHALPGHTPGSVGIFVDELLFSGDSLYARHIALSKLPGEDHAQLRASLAHLFGWIPRGTLVLPGHGATATIADILEGNEALRAFMASGPASEDHDRT